MANNPFIASQDVDNKVPRSVYDQSHQVNLTTKLGQITPFMCKEVLAGDSLRISPELGLRFMPLVFPIQTRMRAYVHFFYVRNRALWSDWMDFIYGTKQNLSAPYLASDSPVSFATGGLADYLGVPTNVYQNLNVSQTATSDGSPVALNVLIDANRKTSYYFNPVIDNAIYQQSGTYDVLESGHSTGSYAGEYYSMFKFDLDYDKWTSRYVIPSSVSLESEGVYIGSTTATPFVALVDDSDSIITPAYLSPCTWNSNNYRQIDISEFTRTYLRNNIPNDGRCSLVVFMRLGDDYQSRFTIVTNDSFTVTGTLKFDGVNNYDLGSVNKDINPFLNGKQPISALPFRAYEAIYNAYYRNQQNDPFKINGEIEYNKWIPSDAGGADSNDYSLHFRNWEPDVFTTCLPSPQQGTNPPLVGITTLSSGEQLTAFRDEDGVVHSVKFTYDSASKSIKSADISDSDEDTIEGRKFYSLMDATTSGITINDLRNVNALQKFLELQQRKGYRYKDLTKGHFDVDIKFDELNMPEFLAGFTQEVFVNQITSSAATQTTDSDGETIDAPLGSWAGQAGAFGNMKDFTHYFDEHGYVIGLLTIVPVPVYTQCLPKHFTKFNKFDYYFPEFANIGMQSVSKATLAPLQWFNQSTDKNETFGYQRPWYEYCSELDTAHGLFRTSLRNFIMNRVFDDVPTLGHDFLAVDPKQLNDVFASTDDTEDKILGEVYLHMSYKTSVPFVSVPRIE